MRESIQTLLDVVWWVNGVSLFCRFRVAAVGVWPVQAVRQHADLAPHVEKGEEGGFHIYEREGNERERLLP